jgi:excisionase family DNA binding protein
MGLQGNSPTLLTLRQTAEYLRASQSFVRKQVRLGLIPHYRLGQKILRFRREDLDTWLSASHPYASKRVESED